MALVAVVASWEWGGLMKLSRANRLFLPVLILLFCGVMAASFPSPLLAQGEGAEVDMANWHIGRWFYLPAGVFWLLIVPLWLKKRWTVFNPLIGCVTGMVVILPTWLALVQLRQLGSLQLLSIMAIVWLADIAAYFFGRALGRHKLAPSISPGKTWEGAIGGCLVVILYGFLFSSRLPEKLAGNYLLLIVLALLAAISIVGDLFESMLKRQVGVKDSSNLLPGHGGVLDRIDSLTSTLPLVALVWFGCNL